jgi:integrase
VTRPVRNPPPRLRQRRRTDGTWRIWWEPETPLRELGFEPVALDPARLTWSVREAARLNAAVDDARGQGSTMSSPRKRGRTVHALIAAYRASPAWDGLSPDTRKGYEAFFRQIEDKWGSAMVADFVRPVMVEWYETLYRTRGPWMAAGLLRHMSVLMSYAERKGWIDLNPCLRLRMVTPPPRRRVAGWEEIDALTGAAESLGLPSIALAVRLALYQGQRQRDIITAAPADFREGMWRLVRSKRGNHGALDIHPDLAPHLQAALDTAGDRARLLHYEGTGRPYDPDRFARAWMRVRARAAETLPALASLQFRDLRRTFGHLARAAGASERDVADALGNSAWTDPKLSGTYMPATRHTASRAVKAIRRPEET